MEHISSKENRLIVRFRRLARHAGSRRETMLFPLEGIRLCLDAAANGIRMETVLLTPDALEKHAALEPLLRQADRIVTLEPSLAGLISETKHAQGVFAIAKIPPRPDRPPSGRLLLLDGIRDPGNLGTLIRTAEAMGFGTALLSGDTADPYSPKVIRATMGSFCRVRLERDVDLVRAVQRLRARRIPVYAATPDPQARPLQEIGGTDGVALVIGSEADGVSDAVRESSTAAFRIPMTGKAESMNAAAAGAIAMWHLGGRHLAARPSETRKRKR